MEELLRYWVSWHQPSDDIRPLTFPPNIRVLGWWCSGYDSDDVPQLCAIVDAPSQNDAFEAISKDWPEAERWRFCDEKPADWLPNNRFPLSDWMKGRLAPEEALDELKGGE
jgi:hypothetical protein